jgi:hypothetical protein
MIHFKIIHSLIPIEKFIQRFAMNLHVTPPHIISMSAEEDQVEIPSEVSVEVEAIQKTLTGTWHVTGVLDHKRNGDVLDISVAVCSGDQCEMRKFTVSAQGGQLTVEEKKRK